MAHSPFCGWVNYGQVSIWALVSLFPRSLYFFPLLFPCFFSVHLIIQRLCSPYLLKRKFSLHIFQRGKKGGKISFTGILCVSHTFLSTFPRSLLKENIRKLEKIRKRAERKIPSVVWTQISLTPLNVFLFAPRLLLQSHSILFCPPPPCSPSRLSLSLLSMRKIRQSQKIHWPIDGKIKGKCLNEHLGEMKKKGIFFSYPSSVFFVNKSAKYTLNQKDISL